MILNMTQHASKKLLTCPITEEMPIFVTGYVSSFLGKILGFLKFVNGHVSIVRANMPIKTPKQGSHTSAGHQHFTCQRSVSHTRIFDNAFI